MKMIKVRRNIKINRKELINLDNLAELNFLSGPNKNVEKSRQYRFRLAGVPPDQAIKLIMINIEQGGEDIKKTIKQEYKLNPIFAIQLIFKGKLLPENINLRKIVIHPEKDIITIMNLMGGCGNQEMRCVQCGTSNVNEILVSFVAEDEQSNLYEDITTLPKFLYYLEYPTDKRGKKISQPVPHKVVKVKNYCCANCYDGRKVEGKGDDADLRIPNRRFGI
ncbi:hypothetical protein ES705_07241 [subsurface metagenome]